MSFINLIKGKRKTVYVGKTQKTNKELYKMEKCKTLFSQNKLWEILLPNLSQAKICYESNGLPTKEYCPSIKF